jgi:YD repeat-containing protein
MNAPDLGAALSPTRYTNFTYTKDGSTQSADGYFLLTATNALNQSTTTTHQTSDGQVLAATAPNGVQVVTTYDPFGRATRVTHFDNTGIAAEPDVNIAYTKCNGGCVGGYGEDANETYAAYRITTVQAGHPTKASWFDLLGREVKSVERGYTGTFIETITLYDALGTASEKFAPVYVGNSPLYFTSWNYDALSRPIVKTSSANDMDPIHGNFVTSYSYAGRTTTITAHGSNVTCPGTSSNLCITMTRSQNALGQYMQTRDANGKYTNFWTEPLGHVVDSRKL